MAVKPLAEDKIKACVALSHATKLASSTPSFARATFSM